MTIREEALRAGLPEVGARENPAGSNWSTRISQYLAAAGLIYTRPPGAPWCMAFVCWCYKQAGHALPYPTASVGLFLEWATKAGELVSRPRRGDLICYRFDVDNWPDHVGQVVRVLAIRWRGAEFVGWVRTLEGNTSAGNNANGGQVQIRYRWVNRCSFVRVPGDA